MCSFLILSLLLTGIPLTLCYHDEVLEQNITNLQHEGVPYKSILEWWSKFLEKRTSVRNTTRVFPLCVQKPPNGDYPEKLQKWASILDDIALKDERVYNHSIHHVQGLIESEFFKELLITPITNYGSLENNDKLNQWIYINIDTRKKIGGFLIQILTGPLGLPGGEFSLEVLCSSPPQNDYPPNLRTDRFLAPCSFVPRSSYTWPHIAGYDGEPTTRLGFAFKWDEGQCDETQYFQFIMIATTNFTAADYEIRLSPLYFRDQGMLEKSGVSNMYYVTMGKFKCGIGDPPYDELPMRLPPNKDYDDCVSKGVGVENELLSWSCPPGPFKCKTRWNTAAQWKSFQDHAKKHLDEFNADLMKDCCEFEIEDLTPPTTTTEAPLGPVAKKEKELVKKSEEAEAESKVTHGGLSIFTWLVVMPLADYTARYFKDLPDFKSLGLGFWILGHVTLHCLAVALLWCSFGLVVGTGNNSLGDVSTKHFLLGILATVIQHVGFFTALKLFNDVKESEAFKFLASHSLGGKLGYLMAFFSILLSTANNATKAMCFGMLCIHLLLVGLTMFFENRQNNILGVGVHRARCPVLQRIIMEDGAFPPMMKYKLIVLVVMGGSLFATYVIMEIVFREAKK